jgi:solute carrier family 13 (sodium-dependent dicarboxylate transporter), member 2/3/5
LRPMNTGSLNDRPQRFALLALFGAAITASVVGITSGWPAPARAGIIAALCLILWLTEWVPIWLPTLVIWLAVPIVLGDVGPGYGPVEVLSWSADPVLILFLSGFTFAAAARHWRLDSWLVGHAVRLSRGAPSRLVAIAAFTTAGLSMWMSNVAAAALVFGALRPILEADDTSQDFRRALLLAVALAADVGGVATPIGSGPNGIAMAAVEKVHRIGFIEWMAFGVPLALGLVVAVVTMTLVRFRLGKQFVSSPERLGLLEPRARILSAVLALTITLWLTEGLHGWPAWLIALGAILLVLALGLLGLRDVRNIDWGTLLLIGGGIALGRLLDRAGVITLAGAFLPFDDISHSLAIVLLCLLSAFLSALMSNTATATLLIPFAATIDPSPSTAILIAVSSSLGVPFVISTPPNAMAVASGLHSRDLLVPGLLLMVGGCLLVATTGPWVLHTVGVR